MKIRKKRNLTTRHKPQETITENTITKYNKTTIGFLNINGITQHSLIEAENTMISKQLTIALLAETKIRIEQDFTDLHIPGYKHFQIRRSDAENQKNGGGLIAYMKTSITTTYEIPINDIEDKELQYVQTERGWIISKNFNKITATCFIYAGYQNTENSNYSWNEGIYKIISKEQNKYQNMGYRVLIIGDLNGHIGNQKEGIKNNKPQINPNGQLIINYTKTHNLMILNRNEKTSGLWTRQANGINTIIDYALLDKNFKKDFISMEIDDNGDFPTQSDHNWIFITLTDNYTNKPIKNINNKKPKKIWNILEDQNWDNYKQDLENNIKNIDKTSIDSFSDSIIKTITESFEKNLGKISIGKQWKKKLPKYIIDLFKQKKTNKTI